MLVFQYPRSFEGLLCAVFEAYTQKRFPDLLLPQGEIPPLQTGMLYPVAFCQQKAGRVFAALRKKLSRLALQKALLVWLAEEPGSGGLLFSYIRRVLDSPRLLELDLTDPVVLEVNLTARKVAHERSKLLGFVRFQKTAEGVYFSAIAPRYNSLSLLLTHFAERFAGESWIIYDIRRGYGVFHEQGGFHAAELEPAARQALEKNGALPPDQLAAGEQLLQQMWQSYFKAVVIQERRNPQLQARCMPRHYWKYLTELQK